MAWFLGFFSSFRMEYFHCGYFRGCSDRRVGLYAALSPSSREYPRAFCLAFFQYLYTICLSFAFSFQFALCSFRFWSNRIPIKYTIVILYFLNQNGIFIKIKTEINIRNQINRNDLFRQNFTLKFPSLHASYPSTGLSKPWSVFSPMSICRFPSHSSLLDNREFTITLFA